MTDAEISRRLALAIGWKAQAVQHFNPPHDNRIVVWTGDYFRIFDYRDPAVIWPIAERYNKFPYALRDKAGELTGQWNAWVSDGEDVQADTAAKAVALAVIKAHKGAKE